MAVAEDAVGEDEAFLVELTRGLAQVRRGRFDVRLARREGLASDVVEQFNELVALKERHSRDLLRISRVVGREGRMSERLDEESYDGAWAADVQSVNALIDDLAAPTAEIARVLDAVAEGDLSQHMALEIEGRRLRGEFRRIGRTVNRMVDQLSSFADEVTRVAREVGTEGKLGGQADVRGVAGTWRALTDSVNTMASNLTNQVRSISSAATAIAEGDLSRKITVSARGEVAELAETINSLTDTLRLFADEVTRVAREVGTEGRLGGQAAVPDVAGTWKNLTEAVNLMAANLTDQVRGIAQVATAVARGDLSQKITVDARGEILELKSTVNTMVDQLSSFADEVTRVAREVGTEGNLGGQAQVPNVSGTWRDLTDNVNQLADNLTGQVRNIAQVTTAVARGDLSQKITVDARGEILELKSTVNTMVDQLSSFADEVTRVAREVGTEGKLGGQAQVPDVSGTWRDLTDNVNYMASNLTGQVRNIAQVTTAVARGDLSQKITVDARGEILELKSTVNTMVDQLSSFADEVTRVAREVGTDGKLGGQAQVRGRVGHLAGPHRQREPAGRQPHRAGAQHRPGDHRGRPRRPEPEDHRGRARGDPGAEVDGQHDGRPAVLVRRRGHPRGPRGRHRGQARRPGAGQGRRRHVAGPDREREPAGRQPDRPGAQHRPGDHRGGPRRPEPEDHRGRPRGDPGAEVDGQHDGRPAVLASPTRSPAWPARSAPRASSAARRRCAGCRAPGGTSPRASTSWPRTLTTQLRAISAVSTAVARGDLTQQIQVAALGEVAAAQGHDQPDDRGPARDHRGERRAGLAGLQPRPHRRAAAGPARPRRRQPDDHGGGRPAGRGPGRRLLPGRRSRWPRGSRALPLAG